MKYLVTAAVVLAAISGPAMALDAVGNFGVGSLSSSSVGGAAGGGMSMLNGGSHQDAASLGSAGAQLTIKPSGVTVLTQQSSAFSANQSSHGLAGGLSFGGTQNVSQGTWSGLAGVVKF